MATFGASIEEGLPSDSAEPEKLERIKEVVSCTQGNPAGDEDASSADTQLQFPPAVEDLLQKLRSESTDSGLLSLHRRDLQTQGWGSIFGGNRDPDIDGSLSSEQVREIRMLVIAAVGQCGTLKVINLSDPDERKGSSNRGFDTWVGNSGYIRLSLAELKTLLEPLGSSDVLTELNLDNQQVLCASAGAKVVCRFLRENRRCEVLHTKMLEHMTASTRSFIVAVMTAVLRRSGNGHPALKYWFGLDSVSMPEAQALLKACPKLQALCWNSGRLTRWHFGDELEAEEWRDVYLEHESLNSVGLEGDARFLIAFMNDVARKGTHSKKFFKRVQLHSTFEPFMEQNAISSLLSATTEILELQYQYSVADPDLLWEDDRVPLGEQSPKALTLSGFQLNERHVLALATLVRENRVPERLNLHRCSVREAKFGVFFRSLRGNTTLRTLDLQGTDGLDDDAFRELLSALEVNSLIHDITGTNWDRVAKIRLRQALEQKERRENYMGVMLRDVNKDELQPSKIGRLFLCGEPYSGKSQLRISLTRLAANPTRHRFFPSLGLRDSLLYRSSSRTEGIEIERMTINGMQISIWDLAGQETFRALHDCLFPKLNIPCVFLLVFSPYDREKKSLKISPDRALRDEMLPWLRFIASSARVVGTELPQVKIQVSHKDKLQFTDLSWAEDVISEMHDQFKDLLAIDVQVLCADNRTQYEGVVKVLDRVEESFRELMIDRALKLPRYCVDIIDALCIRKSHSKSNSQIRPILRADEFLSICRDSASSTKIFQGNHVDSRTVLHAVTAFLHDAGIIIHYPKTGLVVVDPNWYTHSFLGKLIGLGHDFQRSKPLSGTSQRDGLITKPHFEKLLLSLVKELTLTGLGSMSAEDLLSKLLPLIEEMDLCFQVDVQDAAENRQKTCVFAPILFAEPYPGDSSRGMRALPRWSLAARNSDVKPTFVGLRVQCQDSMRTHLTPALFPRFQVWYRRFLISQQARFKDLISCKYNLIHLTNDGYEIYVENDGLVAGDHIDVLVHSYNERQETMKYIMQQVVEKILEFGTSSEGCPGVTFEVSILRSECVQNLTLLCHRDEKVAVPITTLISDWKTAILERVEIEDYGDSNDVRLEYFHTWPKADKAGLEMACERAKDLVLDEHFGEVVASVGDSVREKLRRVSVMENDITRKFSKSSEIPLRSGGSGSRLDSTSTDFRRSTSAAVTRSDYGHQELQELARSINKLDDKVDDVKSLVTEVLSEVKVISALQDNLQQSLASFSSSLDRVIGYSTTKAKIPRRPYFISGSEGMKHWITARLQIGTPVKLHFMCERRTGCHFVDGQEGYPLIVQKRNSDVLRFLSVNSVKILGYLVKAGVHVGGGLATGIPIPDMELPQLGEYMTLTSQTADDLLKKLEPSRGSQPKVGDQGSNCKIDVQEESWRYLQQLFSAPLKDWCSERFQLYKCRYLSLQGQGEPVFAWLCKVCIRKGVSSGEIQVCE